MTNRQNPKNCNYIIYIKSIIMCILFYYYIVSLPRVRFPTLPQFKNRIRSGKGSTQPREDNWIATWLKSSGSGVRMSTLLDLTERNANHIIPSYCSLQLSCRSLVDRRGSLRSCKPQIKTLIFTCLFLLFLSLSFYCEFQK